MTGDNVETFISSISMKLQLLSQDLNGELEKGKSMMMLLIMNDDDDAYIHTHTYIGLMDLMGSFPRAMAELDRLELSGKDLKCKNHHHHHHPHLQHPSLSTPSLLLTYIQHHI